MLAVVSIASSIATIFVGFTWIIGIITGHLALKQIRETGEHGQGYAKAGLIVGYVFGGLTVLLIALLIILMLVAGTVAAGAPSSSV